MKKYVLLLTELVTSLNTPHSGLMLLLDLFCSDHLCLIVTASVSFSRYIQFL